MNWLILFIQWRVLFLSFFMVVVDLSKSMTCLHFHTFIYSKYDIPKWFHIKVLHWITLEQLTNSESRLVTMPASLHTQTRQPNLSVQVLNTRVNFLNVSLTSVHSNSEHGLAILTESFSPLRSVLHNLSCWSPKQKCMTSHAIPILSCATATKVDATVKRQLCVMEISIIVTDIVYR